MASNSARPQVLQGAPFQIERHQWQHHLGRPSRPALDDAIWPDTIQYHAEDPVPSLPTTNEAPEMFIDPNRGDHTENTGPLSPRFSRSPQTVDPR